MLSLGKLQKLMLQQFRWHKSVNWKLHAAASQPRAFVVVFKTADMADRILAHSRIHGGEFHFGTLRASVRRVTASDEWESKKLKKSAQSTVSSSASSSLSSESSSEPEVGTSANRTSSSSPSRAVSASKVEATAPADASDFTTGMWAFNSGFSAPTFTARIPVASRNLASDSNRSKLANAVKSAPAVQKRRLLPAAAPLPSSSSPGTSLGGSELGTRPVNTSIVGSDHINQPVNAAVVGSDRIIPVNAIDFADPTDRPAKPLIRNRRVDARFRYGVRQMKSIIDTQQQLIFQIILHFHKHKTSLLWSNISECFIFASKTM
jgi:hypothetical protein